MASAMALLVAPASALAQAPAPDAVPGELIVRFKSSVGSSQREDVRDRVGADLEERLPLTGLEVVDLDAGLSLAAAESSFERQSGVLYAEPNYYRRAEAAPVNDTLFGQLWGLDNTGQGVRGLGGTADADIDAPEAWQLTTGSNSVKVAVVDTGMAYDHADLALNSWTNPGETGPGKQANVDDDSNGKVDDVRGWDFAGDDDDPRDGNGHGTHVAGTIGARGNDGYGVSGVSQRVTLIPVQVLGANGSGTVADVIAGYQYAVRNGAKVINASLGSSSPSTAERDMIAASSTTTFVVAAGNDSKDASSQYPCNYPLANVICVGASDQDDGLATFSNYGSTSVDLAAPGRSTLSAYPAAVFPNSHHAYLSGTSMATPHVAGAAALILSRDVTTTVSVLRQRLLNSVDAKSCLTGRTVTGGRLNAHAALGALRASPPPAAAGVCSTPPPVG
ncbi:MAG: S8 family serine peptidase, partial [Thermoleophilaceae bacterium]|nr:S8 family serine peptidase [Thermoleophilaceae bacterium]